LSDQVIPTVNANQLAERHLGDAIFANVIMLGMAYQAGMVPIGQPAIFRTIELNGIAVDANKQAFSLGRLVIADPTSLGDAPVVEVDETFKQIVERRMEFLNHYQSRRYAGKYENLVLSVRHAEGEGPSAVSEAVARSLFKLMAYKDEYEVARLHVDKTFHDQLAEKFEGDYRVHYHLAPPVLPLRKDYRGRPTKVAFGPWIKPGLKVLAKVKFLRGTPFDPFGYLAERREERALIRWYCDIVEILIANIGKQPEKLVVSMAQAPMDIRGFGPVKETAIADVRARVDLALRKLV
jgi:indolepyruvate ferredoxin oxidoreductase